MIRAVSSHLSLIVFRIRKLCCTRHDRKKSTDEAIGDLKYSPPVVGFEMHDISES